MAHVLGRPWPALPPLCHCLYAAALEPQGLALKHPYAGHTCMTSYTCSTGVSIRRSFSFWKAILASSYMLWTVFAPHVCQWSHNCGKMRDEMSIVTHKTKESSDIPLGHRSKVVSHCLHFLWIRLELPTTSWHFFGFTVRPANCSRLRTCWR